MDKLIETREKGMGSYRLCIRRYSDGILHIMKKHPDNDRVFSSHIIMPEDMDYLYKCEKEYRETACPKHPGATPPCAEEGCECYEKQSGLGEAYQSILDGRM